MRGFKKVSVSELGKYNLNENDIVVPTRSTMFSAGYDFTSPIECVLKPREEVKIPTGIKACMNDNEVLLIVVRSSLGFKHNIRLKNQVGVIDKDYYDNPSNEGHIMVALRNESNDEVVIKKGDRIVQGIFINYLTVDDDSSNTQRTGGIGSTN